MIKFKQKFSSREDINNLLGGDLRKGITTSSKFKVILIFMNGGEIYTDYFYPKGTYDHCLYTGIGRIGNQDSIENNMYRLNLEVLSHRNTNKKILLFEKNESKYFFVGEYKLTETHQNIQPDELNNLRRVFVFHLTQISKEYIF